MQLDREFLLLLYIMIIRNRELCNGTESQQTVDNTHRDFTE